MTASQNDGIPAAPLPNRRKSAGSTGHRKPGSETINSERGMFMVLDRNKLLKPVEKLQTLVKEIDREPAPRDVHELRTNIRRLEAIFKALSLDRHGIDRSTLKDLGRLRKCAGKVRDMDVLIRYGSTLRPKGEDESAVQLLEHLGSRRHKQGRKLHAQSRRLRGPLRKFLKQTASVLTELVQKGGKHPGDGEAAAHVTATAAKLKAELAVPRRFGKNNLHAFRLKVKELRNILEIAKAPQTKLVARLGAAKDAIGEWHDWEMLATIAGEALDRNQARKLTAQLKEITKNRYREALLLAAALRKTTQGKPLGR